MRKHRHQPIERLFLATVLCFASFSTVLAKPTPVSPIFINGNPMVPPMVPPQVDAITFLNQSTFIYSNNFLFLPFFSTPFSAQSVNYWTNNGVMVGLPGFRFDNTPNPAHLTANQRKRKGANLPKPSQVFYNDGEITVLESLKIHAANVVNPGTLAGDIRARFSILATNGLADLSRGAIQIGDLSIPCVSQSNFFFGPFFFFGTDPAVTYQYLSSGTDGTVGTNAIPLRLDTLTTPNFFFGANFTAPDPSPPFTEYIQTTAIAQGLPSTNRTTNALTSLQSCGQYDVVVHVATNFFGRDISVVFVPTNGISTNVSIQVRFPTNAFFTDAPIVQFGAADFDVIQQQNVTNYFTFRDDGLSIYRGQDCDFESSAPPNSLFTSNLFYNSDFATNTAQYSYTVASAQVGNTNSVFFTNAANATLFGLSGIVNIGGIFFIQNLGLAPYATDPTNFDGSVSIAARDLDLSQSRIRAENAAYIVTSNLLGNYSGFIDAPFITLDARAKNGSLTMSNLVRPQVTRVQANLNSWAGSWNAQVTNTATTFVENWNYHVLILGACVDALHPTIFHKISLHSTNIVIEDKLAVNNSFVLEGQSVTFGSNASLALPRGVNLAFTNLQRVTSFTNNGILSVPAGAYFGTFQAGYVQPPIKKKNKKKPQPPRLETYQNFVNHNAIGAYSVSAQSAYLENVGQPLAPAVLFATNGIVSLNGSTTIVRDAVVAATSDLQITGGNVLISDSVLNSGTTNGGRFTNLYLPGTMILNVTNSLTDGGSSASNLWLTTGGIRMGRRPQNPGDLLGTHIVSRAGTFAQTFHVWAGQDRGATPAGFSNNLAVGRLTLDGSYGNLFRFLSTQGTNAIYVDYLELLNSATNYDFFIGVAPNFTIYFADANIPPEKLVAGGGGRIRWVSDYAGPNSSTNITYPDGVTYTFNTALVSSKDLDSDGDGIANADDCTPIAEGPPSNWFGALCPSPSLVAAVGKSSAVSTRDIGLTIKLTSAGQEVILNWDSAANSANVVEFQDSLTGESWRSLTNFINGPVDARVTVKDAVGAPLRIYRVRVDAGQP